MLCVMTKLNEKKKRAMISQVTASCRSIHGMSQFWRSGNAVPEPTYKDLLLNQTGNLRNRPSSRSLDVLYGDGNCKEDEVY